MARTDQWDSSGPARAGPWQDKDTTYQPPKLWQNAVSGLPSLAAFRDALDQLPSTVCHELSPAVMILDVDRFRAIRDLLGYEASNHLLGQVAQRLMRSFTSANRIAHLSDDVFAILCLEHCDERAARALGLQALDVFREPFTINGLSIKVSVSVGIALVTDCDSAACLAHANSALFRAKESSAGQIVVYDRAMGEHTQQMLKLETELRTALASSAMHMVYQPIVQLPNGQITGHEALMRWTDSIRGAISPLTFIPLAERCGFAPMLDTWALDRVIDRYCRSPTAGFVNVNVSAHSLLLGDWVDDTIARFQRSGLPPRKLQLEITETALLANEDVVHTHLDRLSRSGLPIILDDFGTGYSSLAHLQSFPIDGIKIDRSFVAQIDSKGRERRIIFAITQLARDLELSITAEGVENVSQHDCLIAAGCTYGQGHLYGHPAPSQPDPVTGLRQPEV